MKANQIELQEEPVAKDLPCNQDAELQIIRVEVEDPLPVNAPTPFGYCPVHGAFLGQYCPDPPPHIN